MSEAQGKMQCANLAAHTHTRFRTRGTAREHAVQAPFGHACRIVTVGSVKASSHRCELIAVIEYSPATAFEQNKMLVACMLRLVKLPTLILVRANALLISLWVGGGRLEGDGRRSASPMSMTMTMKVSLRPMVL